MLSLAVYLTLCVYSRLAPVTEPNKFWPLQTLPNKCANLDKHIQTLKIFLAANIPNTNNVCTPNNVCCVEKKLVKTSVFDHFLTILVPTIRMFVPQNVPNTNIVCCLTDWRTFQTQTCLDSKMFQTRSEHEHPNLFVFASVAGLLAQSCGSVSRVLGIDLVGLWLQ